MYVLFNLKAASLQTNHANLAVQDGVPDDGRV